MHIMKNLKNFFLENIKKIKIFIFLIIIKRVVYLFATIYSTFRSGIFWLIKSREHTNFTFMPHSHSIEATKLFIINNFNVDKKKVDEIVSNCINTVTEKGEIYKIRNKNSFIDVDFNNNWDYRILTVLLFSCLDVKYLIEFGVSHGKLPYLIKNNLNFISSDKIYHGVELNKRKGVLLKNTKNNKQFFYFEKNVQTYLHENLVNDFENSIIVCSTHEKTSEESIFDFFNKSNKLPKVIISDEVSKNSSYSKFVKSNDYKNHILTFTDENKFIEPLFVGVSIKNS